MTTGKPGSAHLCLPYDVQKHDVDPAGIWAQAGHDRFPALRYAPDPDEVDRAARRLTEARAPLIICGGVVISGACAELDTLATSLNAPVCTTVSGQGSLADTHPLNAGVVGANGGIPATRDLVANADRAVHRLPRRLHHHRALALPRPQRADPAYRHRSNGDRGQLQHRRRHGGRCLAGPAHVERRGA
jgi:TPP-dependent trihydroxycyclohexane-1,2-dione (THcHDO) dehydratase